MEYVHGGDIYTHKGMTDFSVNLNPFGPGRAVVEAARKSIDQIGNYPDASCRKLDRPEYALEDSCKMRDLRNPDGVG